ncbi:MAG: hypothetical protein WBI17_01280 [Clostridiaceae bacterium]
MSKSIKIFFVTLILAGLVPLHAVYAAPVKINDLIEKAMTVDGQTVTITAEAIGERMDRTDGTWVNVNDGSNAIGIWMPTDESRRITVFGSYKEKGDTLEITGIFNRTCKEHGGESDLHLLSMKVMKTGEIVQNKISITKLVITTVLLGTTLLLILFFINQSKYLKMMAKKNGQKNHL